MKKQKTKNKPNAKQIHHIGCSQTKPSISLTKSPLFVHDLFYFCINNVRIDIIMEDDKKKFLLSRIKREQSLIIGEFQKYKKLYHGKETPLQKNNPFLEQITHTIQINNSLASSLYEYLDKSQMEAVFTRVNTIFSDLIEKYRKTATQLAFLHSNRNVKQIREICDVCHDKIETNRIENIRRGLDEESQCRAAVIKKLIEDSELERTTPVFTEDEDKQFKRELQKVFKNKELVLQTNIHESNVFLATVEQEMAEFMVTFRKDFAEWGGQQLQEENENWGKLMKSYINKKLTNSFNTKIPNWIKKMHDLFVDRQPAKPKQYFMNKECQVGFPTESEQRIAQELEELNHSLIMKRQALKEKERELQHEKIRSKALKAQLESLQKYYVQKLYANSKDGTINGKMAQIQEILGNDSVRNSFINLREETEGDKSDLTDRQDNTRSRSKKKFAKLAYQMMIQKSPKELKQFKQLKQQKSRKSSVNAILSHNKFSSMENPTEKSNNNPLLRKQSSILSSFDGNSSMIQQGGQKLKRKAYNRQKRQELVSDNDRDKNNQSMSRLDEKSELKDEVKLVSKQISQDIMLKKKTKTTSQRRFNSISITEDTPLPQIHEQPKSPSAYILPSNDDPHKLAVSSQNKKRFININQTPSKEISKMEVHEIINRLVEVSKCQEIVTGQDKAKLNKMIQKFFHSLQRRNERSIYYQPVKMSHVVLSGNKENIPLSPNKEPDYLSLGKSIKKQQRRQYESYQRKNKSLHTHILKLPAISIKNYNMREFEVGSNVKEDISLFIDETSAQQFQSSFQISKERNIVKPTPSQLQSIQKMFSQLQLLKRRNQFAYLKLCSFLRFPFSSTRQKSPLVSLASGFTFSSFCNYFMKLLWMHRDCHIADDSKFCLHVQKIENKLMAYLPERNTNRVKRSERLEITNGVN